MLILLLGVQPISLMLTKALCQEGHDVCVISENAQKLEWLQQKIDCKTIVGCPSHPHVLREADAEHADVLIAATKNDEMNMVACQVGYSLFHIPKKIAFISSAHYLVRHELFGDANLPIDVFINAEQLVAQQLDRLICHPQCKSVQPIPQMPFCLVTTTLPTGSPWCGQDTVSLQASLQGCHILHVVRQTPLYEAVRLAAGDDVIMLCHNQQLSAILNDIHSNIAMPINLSISAPFGVIDCFADLHDPHDSHIKVLEADLATCHQLAPKHPNMTILHGHLTDHDFLMEEQMGNADVFCALSDDDEDNIMASLQAKDLGAKKAIAMITSHHYRRMMQHTPIDHILNPNHEVAGRILAQCYHDWIQDIFMLPTSSDVLIRIIPTCQHDAVLWSGHKLHTIVQRQDMLIPINACNTIESDDQLLIQLPNTRQIETVQKCIKKIHAHAATSA